ncbi:MAG: hypothetical protein ACPGUV_14840, partial [Polyangiales bacterium]
MMQQHGLPACWVGVQAGIAGLLLHLLPVAAVAQPGATLDQFRPSESVADGFALSRPDDAGHGGWGLQLYLDYANDPLVFEARLGNRDSETAALVAHQLVAHVGAYVGLFDRLLLFGTLPATLVMQGDDLPPNPPADGAGIGDPWLGARLRLLGATEDFFSLGLQASLTFPLADAAQGGQAYLGDRSFSVHPELLAELRPGPVRLTANLGARARQNAQISPALEVGDELTYGLGVTVPVIPARLDAHAELYGALGFQDFAGRQTSPIEALAGVKAHWPQGWTLGAALGPGLSRGYGSPNFRALLMVGFSPKQEAQSPTKVEVRAKAHRPSDRDGDGIADDQDQCPDAPEDRDGFADEDGCPDPDNDDDGVLDQDDRCPLEPGPAAQQGCPESGDGTLETEEGEPFALGRIEFALDSDDIKDESTPVLERIRSALEAHPELKKIRIEGHTDALGSAA